MSVTPTTTNPAMFTQFLQTMQEIQLLSFNPYDKRFSFDLSNFLRTKFDKIKERTLPVTHPYEYGFFARIYQEVSLLTRVIDPNIYFKPLINTLSNIFILTPLAVAAFVEGLFKVFSAYTIGLGMLPLELCDSKFEKTSMVLWSNYGMQGIACIPQQLTRIVEDLIC